MANKKIVIPKGQLPSPTSDNSFLIKYRLIADRTKASDWSTTEVVKNVSVASSAIVPSYSSTTKILSVVWQPSNANLYDVFVKYGSSETFTYAGSTMATNYSIIVPEANWSSTAVVRVQSNTSSHEISNSLLVALTSTINLV
jgi:hypothetical protein